jgi:hypothetical protein
MNVLQLGFREEEWAVKRVIKGQEPVAPIGSDSRKRITDLTV